MTFSQYFSSLPPIYKCDNGLTLAPFNIYTITTGYDVVLPNIESPIGEWVMIINTDGVPYSDTQDDPEDYKRPGVSVVNGQAKIKITSLKYLEGDYEKVTLYPGQIFLFIRVDEYWALSSIDMSQLVRSRISDLNNQVKQVLINNLQFKSNFDAIDAELKAHTEIIFREDFKWYSYTELYFGILLYPDVQDDIILGSVTYWKFDLQSLRNEDMTIYYPTDAFWIGTNFILIEDSKRLTRNYNLLIYAQDETKVEGYFSNDDATGKYTKFSSKETGLYKVNYDRVENIIRVDSADYSELPRTQLNTRVVNLENNTNNNMGIPHGSEFPNNPTNNLFIIDAGTKYVKGLYYYDTEDNSWYSQF